MRHQDHFAKALKTVRKARVLTQEDFSTLSSRTYVSTLERGLKSPTLNKVNELAEILDVHPLTLLLLAYSSSDEAAKVKRLLVRIERELHSITCR